MKILLVVHDFLPEHLGGTEVHTHHLAGALVERGHRVRVLATERDPAAPPGDLRARRVGDVEVSEAVHQREYGDVAETWREEQSGALFQRLLEEQRPDVVHFQHLLFWGAGCLSHARAAGCATLVTLHDYHLLCDRCTLLSRDGPCDPADLAGCPSCLDRHPYRPSRWGADPVAARRRAQAERLAFHRRHLAAAQVVIAPSDFLAAAHSAAGLGEAARIRRLDLPVRGPRREPRRSDPTRPLRVGYVGGILRAKGVHVLVEAMGLVPPGSLELDLFGPLEWFPDYVADLRRRASGLPVRFQGRFEPDQIGGVLDRIDLLVLPSLWFENRPLVLLEAWAAGIPVIASDLGGMAEAVRPGVDGLLVPPGDAAALAEALETVARDRELLARLAARRPAATGLEDFARCTEGIYEGCVERARP